MQEKESYKQKHYTVSGLSAEVLRMETGLPTKEVFNIVVLHTLRFKYCIVYYTHTLIHIHCKQIQQPMAPEKINLLLIFVHDCL